MGFDFKAWDCVSSTTFCNTYAMTQHLVVPYWCTKNWSRMLLQDLAPFSFWIQSWGYWKLGSYDTRQPIPSLHGMNYGGRGNNALLCCMWRFTSTLSPFSSLTALLCSRAMILCSRRRLDPWIAMMVLRSSSFWGAEIVVPRATRKEEKLMRQLHGHCVYSLLKFEVVDLPCWVATPCWLDIDSLSPSASCWDMGCLSEINECVLKGRGPSGPKISQTEATILVPISCRPLVPGD